MKKSFWLKPRSAFQDFQTHREYANRRRIEDLGNACIFSVGSGVIGCWVVSEALDPAEHVSSIRVATFIGTLLAGQFYYFRSLAAKGRESESWEDFTATRERELEAQPPPADVSSQEALAELPEALPPPSFDYEQQPPPQSENQDRQQGE